jgi:hypothetical protein
MTAANDNTDVAESLAYEIMGLEQSFDPDEPGGVLELENAIKRVEAQAEQAGVDLDAWFEQRRKSRADAYARGAQEVNEKTAAIIGVVIAHATDVPDDVLYAMRAAIERVLWNRYDNVPF